VLRYLEAIRLAVPHEARAARGKAPALDERRWAAARRLVAPRTLAEIDRRAARDEDHPLAPWLGASRDKVLHSFQLLAARRAPLGAAVVTVTERFSRPGADEPLDDAVSEYLVVRIGGEWRLADRRPGGAFDPEALADALAELGVAAEPSP
jgi:hypothetical protein